MAQRKGLRPRVLSATFGIVFLLMAIIAYWFATGPGSSYKYTPDVTQWALAAYLFAGAALLAGVGVVAVGEMRSLDRRIEQAENEGGVETIVEEVVAMEEERNPDVESEGLPPPLEEAPAASDHVDQDIDDLLVSLEEIETVTEETEQQAPSARPEPAAEPAPTRRVITETRRTTSTQLEALKRRRQAVPAFFAGPALTSVGIVAITAALLPGSGANGMLQSNYQLNTAALLGIGYSFGFAALFAVLAIFGMLRTK